MAGEDESRKAKVNFPFLNFRRVVQPDDPAPVRVERPDVKDWTEVTGSAPFVAVRCGRKFLLLCQELATVRNIFLINKINRSFNPIPQEAEVWSDAERDDLTTLLYDRRLWDLL